MPDRAVLSFASSSVPAQIRSGAMLAVTTLLVGLISVAQAAPPSYIDIGRITQSLERAQSRHNASLRNFHNNEMNHPELFQERKRLIGLAGGMEVAERARRERKRQQVDFAKRQSTTGEQGIVPLLNFFSEPLDIMIYGNVSIGTPGQTFPLLFDTGSADLWVYENGVGSPNPEWDAAQSTTAVTDPSIPWSIQYGKGEQEGFLNQDQVALGGYEVETVFAAATTLNEAFAPYPISGIFGLGFGVISSSGYIPWFERLLNQSLVASPYFSLYLVRASEITEEAEGSVPGAELCVGCYNPSRYTGEISWNTVTSTAFWTIDMDGIAFNGSIIDGTSMGAALDSGTTLIQIPVAAATAFYNLIGGVDSGGGDGTWIIDCDVSIGSIAFVFNGEAYEIPPQDLLRAISRDGSKCMLTIAGVDNVDARGNPVAIIGDAFLKNAYSIYSYSHNGAPAIGLAHSTIAGSWAKVNGTGGSSSSSTGPDFSMPSAIGTISVGDPGRGSVSSVVSATGEVLSGSVTMTGAPASSGTSRRSTTSGVGVTTVTVTPTSGATRNLATSVVGVVGVALAMCWFA